MRQPLTSQAAGDRLGSAQSGEEMQPAITSHPQEAASDIPLSTRLFCKSLGINYFVSHKTDGQASWVLTLVLGFGHQSKQAILPGPTQASCPLHMPYRSLSAPSLDGSKKTSHPTVQSEELGPLYGKCPMDTGSNPRFVTHRGGPWSSVLTPQPACLKHGDSTRPGDAPSPASL